MKKYILLFLLVLAIEIFIGVYIHDAIIRPYIGDLLVVVLIYYFVRIFIKGDTKKIAFYVFLFACLIEVGQYFNLVSLLHLEQYKIARIIVGTSFSWIDIFAYLGGFLVIIFGSALIHKKEDDKL